MVISSITYTYDENGPVVTDTYMLYFPIVHQERETAVTSYYYAGGERIAMRHGQSYYYVFGDHLGSTTTVVERDTGRTISRQLYHPWGTTRYSSGAQAADYGYTGQMKVDDIYYYNARWYDPTLGRFMQADTIVPSHQGTQGFDRYAYVNNNPMRYTDPTGHLTCYADGRCYVDGWQNDYLIQQDGNTCGVVSLTMAMSSITGIEHTQTDLQPLFPQTYGIPKIRYNGLGTPAPQLVMGININYEGIIHADLDVGSSISKLKENVLDDKFTIILFGMSELSFFGHYVLVIGYSEEEGLLFADPNNRIYNQAGLANKYCEYVNSSCESFEDLWGNDSRPSIAPFTMITLLPYKPISFPSLSFPAEGSLPNYDNIFHLR